MKKLLFGISALLLTLTLAACTGQQLEAAFDFESDQGDRLSGADVIASK